MAKMPAGRWSSTTSSHSRTPVASSPASGDQPSYAIQVSTFEQDELKPSDYCDISSQNLVKLSRTTPAGKPLEPSNVRYGWSRGGLRPSPFPPRTKGFFYYHRNMQLDAFFDEETGEEVFTERPTHVAASQLRFRVVDLPDSIPSTQDMFDYGSDLMMEDGIRPWNIHVLAMQKQPEYHALYDTIVPSHERALIEDFLERSRQNTEFHNDTYSKTSNFLESILDPFPLNFGKNSIKLSLLDPDCVTKLSLRHILTVQPRKRSTPWEPNYDQSAYSGKALVRFELVNVTRKNNVPSTRLAIRILQWIEPPNPSDKLLVQQEGELLKKCDPKTLEEKVWTKRSFVDILPPASVQMLLDAYPNSETVTLGRLETKRVSVQEEKV